ncbi:MAG: ABC transporter permease [Bdellovibrionaceae bacterium]|nr:ABC transporter permease [Pseudobdellovibrionaceae bacterium]MDW8191192.1 ABC transporter permease [Pseudobdellovibrionaceae bacterium]
MILGIFQYIKRQTLYYLESFGELVVFGWKGSRSIFSRPFRFLEFVRHFEFIGNRSFFIVALTGLFTGLALSFQVYLGFKIVNATNLVGPVVALGIARELGPVLTGLIIAARAGGAIAARLGSMRVNEQMDALDVMGVDTFNYLIGPRILAATISTPLLTAIFDFFAMFGAWILVVFLVGLDQAVFWDKIAQVVKVRYLFEGLFKALVFGYLFSIVCTFKGYHAKGGAQGVGEATNQGVVNSMVSIIVLDYFLMNLIRLFYYVMGIQD